MLKFEGKTVYLLNMKNDTKAAELLTENTALKSKVAELEALVKYYEEQFRLARHRQFGASSEKSEYDQLNLFNEAEATADANEPELVEIQRHYRKSCRLLHDRLPKNLPIEILEHDLPAEEQICPECGGDLHVMGREKRRELVTIPAQVKIREHVRKVYACRDCEKDECGVPIVKAPVDNPVIKGGFASSESVAHIMVQKFVMGVPLCRQEQEWNRNGIMLSRQTMSNWLIKATEDWLEPIYDAMREILCVCHDVLHADETTLQVFKKPGKAAQSKSYMWLYRTGSDARHPIVLYAYQPDRKAKRPKEFLKDFLFANTPRGAKASAVMFSIIEAAKENGLNPFAYLTYVFKHAPNWDIRDNLDYLQCLLPSDVPDSCMPHAVMS